MGTRIYGASDDLIEFEGDVSGEVGHYTRDNDPALIVCSDGTVLTAKYGKDDQGIWQISVIRQGDLFLRIEPCDSEDADPYSDQAFFGDGLKWAYAAKDWGRVR